MLKSWLRKEISNKFPDAEFDILTPPDPRMGDYSVNLAFVLAKKDSKNPMKIGEELVAEFGKDKKLTDVFEKIEVVKPGFVNFYLKKEFLQKKLLEIYKKLDSFGKSNEGNGKIVIVEYSSPNIAKPMHIGHLRSTVIGDALANVYEVLGYKVIRWNYIGDWGTQFGKLIAALKRNEWGSKKDTPTLEEMVKLYVEQNQIELATPEGQEKAGQEEFAKLENGDKENVEIWKKFRDVSLRELEKMYARLGVNKFDVAKGESDYEPKLKLLIEELRAKGIAKESKRALIIELPNLPPAMLQKSDGATLYMTRELASLEDRIQNYNADKVLYVVANQQALHFEQLFAIWKMISTDSAELVHVKFGMVLGEDGKKLATREGKIIPLQEVIDKIVALALKVVEEKNSGLSKEETNTIAKAVGIGALKYNDLKQHPHTDVVFDWKAMLDISGNSGPYLQYTYARLVNILEKAEDRKAGDVSTLVELEEEKIMKRLLEFPEAIEKCAELNTLNGLALYLYELANDANGFYESIRVLDDDNVGRRNARLVLIKSVASVLKRGLGLLGIPTLKKI